MNEQEGLVTAQAITSRFSIPRATLYRLVDQGVIPCHESPRQPWHKRRHLLFSVDEVAAALANLAEQNR